MEPSPHVLESQGQREDEKVTHVIPGGVPIPHFVPERPLNQAKALAFSDDAPNHFIADLTVNILPPGQFEAVLHYCKTLAYAEIDNGFEGRLRLAEETKKCTSPSPMINHVLGPSLTEQLETHQRDRYSSKHAIKYNKDIDLGNPPNEIVMRTYVEMLDGDNRRTGSWYAYWTVVAENQEGVTEAQLSGQVQIKVYSFEDANTHMKSSQTFNPIMIQSHEQLANAIVRQISTWEDELKATLQQFYDNGVDGTLKQIRRVLPITRTKMKWEPVADRAVKIHKEIQKY